MAISKDVLWKGIIEDFFTDFLLFFFAERSKEIDFSKDFEFLDKELEKIQIDSKSKRRRIDKLVKVYLKNGEEEWFLIHIEVQGYKDGGFPFRMFVYHYRLLDKFDRPVTSLAIFTDDNPNYHPKEYLHSHWGTEIRFRFNTYKLLEKEEAEFERLPGNAFSIVMKSAWIALKKNKDALLDNSISIARELMKSGFSKKRPENY